MTPHHRYDEGPCRVVIDYRLHSALQLEWVCDVYLQARAAGAVRVLPDDEIAGVVAQLASYGQTYRG